MSDKTLNISTDVGIILSVEGVSRKGKNRIVEHGDHWKVVLKNDRSVLLESVKTKYWRWMNLNGDPDFKVNHE